MIQKKLLCKFLPGTKCLFSLVSTQRLYKRNIWCGFYSTWQATDYERSRFVVPSVYHLPEYGPSMFEISFIRSSHLLEYMKKSKVSKKNLFVSADLCMGRKWHLTQSSPLSFAAFGILQAYFAYHIFFLVLEFVNTWGKISSKHWIHSNYKRSKRCFWCPDNFQSLCQLLSFHQEGKNSSRLWWVYFRT